MSFISAKNALSKSAYRSWGGGEHLNKAKFRKRRGNGSNGKLGKSYSYGGFGVLFLWENLPEAKKYEDSARKHRRTALGDIKLEVGKVKLKKE